MADAVLDDLSLAAVCTNRRTVSCVQVFGWAVLVAGQFAQFRRLSTAIVEVLQESNHWPWIEESEAFSTVLARWLARPEASSPDEGDQPLESTAIEP
jgi:hypothetical protein